MIKMLKKISEKYQIETATNKLGSIVNKIIGIPIHIIYILEFIVSILFSISLYKLIYYKTYLGFTNKLYLFIFIIAAVLLLVIIFTNIKKYYKQLEKIFLILMIPIGMLYITFLIVKFVPDEQAHFYRAYDISQGVVFTDIDVQRQYIPKDILKIDTSLVDDYNLLNKVIKEKTNYNSQKEEVFNTAQSYSPIMYILTSFGCFIGKIFGLNIFITMYLGRLLNFIFFLILGYYAIKYMPFGKLVMFVFLFNPMLIQEAISVSADSFINIIVLLFLSFTLRLLFKKDKLNIYEKIIFAILLICVSFSKYVYFPLIFIALLFLKKESYKEKKDKLFIIVFILIGLAISFFWTYIGMQFEDIREYIINNNVNTKEQIEFILKNPNKYIDVVFKTIQLRGEDFLYQFLGNNLALNNDKVKITPILSIIYLFLLLISPFLEKNEKALNKFGRINFSVIFLSIFLLVITALYIAWTSVGKDVIDGVQGRYFIPIMILPLLCLVQKDKYIEFKKTNLFFSAYIVFLNIVVIKTIIIAFL